jgi:hypothetical protein
MRPNGGSHIHLHIFRISTQPPGDIVHLHGFALMCLSKSISHTQYLTVCVCVCVCVYMYTHTCLAVEWEVRQQMFQGAGTQEKPRERGTWGH